jgi:hypothetical protein
MLDWGCRSEQMCVTLPFFSKRPSHTSTGGLDLPLVLVAETCIQCPDFSRLQDPHRSNLQAWSYIVIGAKGRLKMTLAHA